MAREHGEGGARGGGVRVAGRLPVVLSSAQHRRADRAAREGSRARGRRYSGPRAALAPIRAAVAGGGVAEGQCRRPTVNNPPAKRLVAQTRARRPRHRAPGGAARASVEGCGRSGRSAPQRRRRGNRHARTLREIAGCSNSTGYPSKDPTRGRMTKTCTECQRTRRSGRGDRRRKGRDMRHRMSELASQIRRIIAATRSYDHQIASGS